MSASQTSSSTRCDVSQTNRGFNKTLSGRTELPGIRKGKAETIQALKGVKSLCELSLMQEPESLAMYASQARQALGEVPWARGLRCTIAARLMA